MLNNQLDTPIARRKTGAVPDIGGPAIHEFPTAYLQLKGNRISVFRDAKKKQLEGDKELVITGLTRVLVGVKLRIGIWVYDARINDVEYLEGTVTQGTYCLLYTSPSPRDRG